MGLDIRLDRTSRALLSHQIGRSIVNLIAAGALRSGTRLPATRVLAQQLGVARMTIVDAYSWLAEQGYVEARRGSGTIVREMHMTGPRGPCARSDEESLPDIAQSPGARIDFRPGLPDLGLFPRKQWIATLTRTARLIPEASLGYGEPLGRPALRSAIASYLHRSRGFQVNAANVVIPSIQVPLHTVDRGAECAFGPSSHDCRATSWDAPVRQSQNIIRSGRDRSPRTASEYTRWPAVADKNAAPRPR